MSVALLGLGLSKGTAIGKARILQHGQLEILEYVLPPHLIEDEVARFEAALAGAKQQLRAIRDRIPADAPPDVAAFIDTYLLMLDDQMLAKGPVEIIRSRHCNAEWALKVQKDSLVRVFDSMDDPYLRSRRDDVEHVVFRIQHLLLNRDRHNAIEDAGEGRIVLADEISPAELVLLHHQKIAAIATERGGSASHTAILARSLGIPAVAGLSHPAQLIRDDEVVVVDGERGALLAGLAECDLGYFRQRQTQERHRRNELRKLRDVASVSRDGVAITLHANVELPEDVTAMRQSGTTGIGLFRTEFLFMNRPSAPGEEEQYEAYKHVIKRLKGAPITIRTLDLGADKQPGSGVAPGPNPALGLRGIRLCLKEHDLFIPQLRAILRASAHGPVRMLVPMLTNVRELQQTLDLVSQVKQDLERERIRFDPQIPIGGMIEVPASALCADSFARRLDFMSIGTNDLIQYTLATDRMDEEVSHLYEPLHPAVLRLIHLTLQHGARTGVPVSMCGEMAGDPTLTRLLLGLGLTEFSMPPAAAPEVKHVIIESNVTDLRKRVAKALRSTNPERVAEQLAALNNG
jgi:phosphotransferase system enzyme I (PtsI)